MTDESLTPAEIRAAEELAKAQKELASQLVSAGIHAAAKAAPPAPAEIPAMGTRLYQSGFIGAGAALIGLIPPIPPVAQQSDAARKVGQAERLAAAGEQVAAQTAKLNNVRKEADAAREVARPVEAGKQEVQKPAETAKTLTQTAEAAAKQAQTAPNAPPSSCVPCA